MKTFSRRKALAILLLAGCGMAACRKESGKKPDPNVAYYTCTMHPSVRSQDPDGKCPICSMDLVPVFKKQAAEPGQDLITGTAATPALSEFSVPVARQQQIGVTYATAEMEPLRRTIRSVGMVVPNKLRQWNFVARADGYVEQLQVASPGERVVKGQSLLTLYSPELVTAERELVGLLEARDRGAGNVDRLIEASRARLEQWNVTTRQIDELEKTRKPSELLTLFSPFDGVVQEVPVSQGSKVAAGDSMVTVADLSTVWVWLDFYEDEVRFLAAGQTVELRSAAFPGEEFEGRISLIDPFVNSSTRTARARIGIPNPDAKLRPGMYLNAGSEVEMGRGLTIPISAVMPTGLHNLVFIDKGEGKLEPRFIELGGAFGDSYQVLSGLREGERVVASANFLIDAESKVQGAVKAFEEPNSR